MARIMFCAFHLPKPIKLDGKVHKMHRIYRSRDLEHVHASQDDHKAKKDCKDKIEDEHNHNGHANRETIASMSLEEEIVEISLDYEGIPNQCSNYFVVDHLTNNCKNKKVKLWWMNKLGAKSSKDQSQERQEKAKEPNRGCLK